VKLFGSREPEVCPYVGELDESGESSIWKCKYPNRREENCKLTNPNEWEKKCPYVLETRAALEGRKVEVAEEREAQEPLVTQAKSFIDRRLGRAEPIKASAESIRAKTYQPRNLNEAQAYLLSNARPLIHNKEVLLFYLMPEDYDELVAMLGGGE